MTKDEIMKSNLLKSRFCNDCNLPIGVFDNPYFEQRLEIMDSLYGCIDKFNTFCDELSSFGNEQEYLTYYNEVKNQAIDFIKQSFAFYKFLNHEVDKCDKPAGAVGRTIYEPINDGKTFISIDMKRANFSALKHFSPEIFDGADTWEEFIGKFTTNRHIINSKYIRQVILGACNPHKQIVYEESLMTSLCKYITDALPEISIYGLSVDEIVINVPEEGCGFSLSKLREVVGACPLNIGDIVKVETFSLEMINGGYGYIKVYNDDSNRVEFKCVGRKYLPQIIKHFFGRKISEDDLVFEYGTTLARFLNSIDNPWEN